MDKYLHLGGLLIFTVAFVGLLNWLGGEKYLFFNKARKDLRRIRALNRTK